MEDASHESVVPKCGGIVTVLLGTVSSHSVTIVYCK